MVRRLNAVYRRIPLKRLSPSSKSSMDGGVMTEIRTAFEAGLLPTENRSAP